MVLNKMMQANLAIKSKNKIRKKLDKKWNYSNKF